MSFQAPQIEEERKVVDAIVKARQAAEESERKRLEEIERLTKQLQEAEGIENVGSQQIVEQKEIRIAYWFGVRIEVVY